MEFYFRNFLPDVALEHAAHGRESLDQIHVTSTRLNPGQEHARKMLPQMHLPRRRRNQDMGRCLR